VAVVAPTVHVKKARRVTGLQSVAIVSEMTVSREYYIINEDDKRILESLVYQ
jgi:hypothetical protein